METGPPRKEWAGKPTLFLVKCRDEVVPAAAAKRLNTDYRIIGMDAANIDVQIAELNAMLTDLMQMFNQFLSRGLLIGVTSLGVVAYCAARTAPAAALRHIA